MQAQVARRLLNAAVLRRAHLDGTLQHLGEPQGVQEIEDEVHAANHPKNSRRYTAWPRVR